MLKPQVLKNGLTVLKFPKNSSRVCVLGFVCPTGSSVEEGYFPQGISYLIERLFWYGTDKHPSTKSLNLILESMGGNFTSFTNQELTGFYITVPDYHQYKAVSLLAEIIQRSYFDARDIENEKKQIVELIKNRNENVDWDIANLALNHIYTDFSLGNDIMGSIDTINSINQENILEYLSHQYTPSRCYLIIGGNFENKNLIELIEQEWSIWNPRNKKFIEQMDFHPDDIRDLPSVVYRQKGISQTYLAINFLLSDGLKPTFLAKMQTADATTSSVLEKESVNFLRHKAVLMVLNTLLGEGLSSRLWLKTVEEGMLFHKISSELVLFSQTGFLQILGQIDNSQFSFGLESILSVLEAFKKTTVSINELAKAKEYLQSRLIMEQENLLESINWKVENYLGSGLNYELEDILELIRSVEATQIRNLALDLFVPKKLCITTLGTAKETRLVDKLIKKYLS